MRRLIVILGYALIISSILFLRRVETGKKELLTPVKAGNGDLEPAEWQPRIVEDINAKGMEIALGTVRQRGLVYPTYVDENREPMVAVPSLKELFSCGAYFVDEKTLRIDAGDRTLQCDSEAGTIAEVKPDGAQEVISGDAYRTETRDARVYVSLRGIADTLGYSSRYIGEDYEWRLLTDAGEPALPSRYDYRDLGRQTGVKNQGYEGTCWAFAATTAVESAIDPAWHSAFSADHVVNKNSYGGNMEEGGNMYISRAYYSGWQGPVADGEDPYGDGFSPDGLDESFHVQQMRFLEDPEIEEIKRNVYRYGGVESPIYLDMEDYDSYSPYYRSDTSAYCYTGEEDENHDVVIIGWDDSYPASNFSVPVSRDGAWICQNSWGEEFGESGVFYVSYDDKVLGRLGIVYSVIEQRGNYDRIYQSDLCGWVGVIGFGTEDAYFANAYTAQQDEELMAAGIYTVGENTSYEIYVVEHYTGEESLAEKELVAEGKVEATGYYTIPFRRTVPLRAGERFAIVAYVLTPGEEQPVAIEYRADELSQNVDITDGEGYISYTGDGGWYRIEEEDECNVCLKAYTRNR